MRRWFRINDQAIQFFADSDSTEQDIQAAAAKMFNGQQQAEKRTADLKADNERLRTALRFYARKEHIADPDDELCHMVTEPNWIEHSSARASERGWADNSAVLIEDGSIARRTLLGQVIEWQDENGEDQTPRSFAGEPT